jgi:chromosome segregation ATPase
LEDAAQAAQNAELERELGKAQEQLEAMKQKFRRLRAEYGDLQVTAAALEGENEQLTGELQTLQETKAPFDKIPGVLEKMKKAKLVYKKFEKAFNESPEEEQIIRVGDRDWARPEIQEHVAKLRGAYVKLEAKWNAARRNAGMAELDLLRGRYDALKARYQETMTALRVAQQQNLTTVDEFVKLLAKAKVAELGPEAGMDAALAEIRAIAKNAELWKTVLNDSNMHLATMEGDLHLGPLPDEIRTPEEERDFFEQRMGRLADALPEALECTMWIKEG